MPFAGWAMPVQYKEGLVTEHLHCRKEAVLFDVSHMLQSKIEGKDRIKLAELITVGKCNLARRGDDQGEVVASDLFLCGGH